MLTEELLNTLKNKTDLLKHLQNNKDKNPT